jgi:hypothetical protein
VASASSSLRAAAPAFAAARRAASSLRPLSTPPPLHPLVEPFVRAPQRLERLRRTLLIPFARLVRVRA